MNYPPTVKLTTRQPTSGQPTARQPADTIGSEPGQGQGTGQSMTQVVEEDEYQEVSHLGV